MQFYCPHCHSRLTKSQPSVCRDCSRDIPSTHYEVDWENTWWGQFLIFLFGLPLVVLGGILGGVIGAELGFEMPSILFFIVIGCSVFPLIVVYLIFKLFYFIFPPKY